MNYDTNIHLLKLDIHKGNKIVLLIGAGINTSKGIKLQWNDLLNPIYKDALRNIFSANNLPADEFDDILSLFDIESNTKNNLNEEKGYQAIKAKAMLDYSALIKMSIAKNVLKKQYIYALQNVIYKECNKYKIKEAFEKIKATNPEAYLPESGDLFTLYTIARMIILNPNIAGIITYNYDNFLTQAIDILQSDIDGYFSTEEAEYIRMRLRFQNADKLNVVDIYNGNTHIDSSLNTISIYHPHGFIPPPNQAYDLSECNVVMSQDEFNETTWKSHVWSNDAQVHLMSQYNLLIIGSSCSDLTTQRMLYYAIKNGNKNRLYYLGSYPRPHEGISDRCHKAQANLTRLKSKYLESIGLTPIICIEGYARMLSELNRINHEYATKSLENIRK